MLHDLHESVPYLYDNTVGDGPYNAWIDPILAGEWQMMGWDNVAEMTKFGMPGVFTHGTFDTWSPSYLMFIAAMHNGISRLYETFGNGGADTEERTLDPDEFARTWYKQNPPLPKAKWSQRDNNNYEETGLLTALAYFSANNKLFLRNFYLKAKRSIDKARTEGPAAYVFPADDPRPGAQADLLRMLQEQGCEISRATAPFTVMMLPKKAPPKRGQDQEKDQRKGRERRAITSRRKNRSRSRAPSRPAAMSCAWISPTAASRMRCSTTNTGRPTIRKKTSMTIPAGLSANSATCRWRASPTQSARCRACMRSREPWPRPAAWKAPGDIFLINHNADSGLITLRYRFPDASFEAAEEPFEAAGHKFNRGSFIVRGVAAGDLSKAAAELGVAVYAAAAAPDVKTHALRAARIAIMHTWLQHAERWLVAPGIRSPENSVTITSARRPSPRLPGGRLARQV